jgi:hypothetical protein
MAEVGPISEHIPTEAHWQLPAGIVLGSSWKRVAAFLLDQMLIMALLGLLTRGGILLAWDLSLLASEYWWVLLLDWVLIFCAHWLYHKYTCRWLGRSLAQRLFGLAIVSSDATLLDRSLWGRRSAGKLRYLIPLLGQLWFAPRDILLIHRRHTHQSSLDLAVGSAVVVADSLPRESRLALK